MRSLATTFAATSFLFIAAAAQAETTVRQVDISQLVDHCDAPVASIMVGAVACKASGCNTQTDNSGMARLMALAAASDGQMPVDLSHLGDGTTNALVTALRATRCFSIQERETIDAMKAEAQMAGVEFKPKPVDFMVMGAITSVDVSSKSSAVGGGFIPVVGAIKNTKKHAEIAIDIRVIDMKTTDIKDARSFNATSDKSNWGVGGAGYSNGGLLFGGATSTKSAELDSVANQSVFEAANFITETLAASSITTHAVVPAAVK